MVETTVNIGATEMNELANAVEGTGSSRRAVISAMLKYMAVKSGRLEAEWGRVRYQERRPRAEWKTLHVRLGREEYNFFMDLKKVMKLSVSFLIAEAIRLYLDELLVKLKGNVDSYRYKNYAMSKVIIQDVICWVFYWGIPPTLLTFPPP